MSYISLPDLRQALAACQMCPLHQEAIGPVPFYGSLTSPIVIVGEGPGRVEDEYGVPLIGPSGQLFDKALASVGMTRDRIYTTNTIKCRPKNNRTPTIAEGKFCAQHWLDYEISLLQPKIIIALGSVALKYLAEPDARITKQRGQWFKSIYNIECMATFHPAYLLRLSGQDLIKAKWQVFYDLKAVADKCRQLEPDYPLASDQPPRLLEICTPRKTN